MTIARVRFALVFAFAAASGCSLFQSKKAPTANGELERRWLDESGVVVSPWPADGPERPHLEGRRVRIEDIAKVSSPAPLAAHTAPVDVDVHLGPPSHDGARAVSLAPKSARVGMLRVGPYRGWTGGPYPSFVSAVLPCGGARELDRPKALRWIFAEATDGGLEVTLDDAKFSPVDCGVDLERRVVLRPTLVVPEARLYAARVCDVGGDCDKRGELVLVFPRTRALIADGVEAERREIGAFSVVTIPYAPGRGAGIVTEVDKLDVKRFERVAAPGTPIGEGDVAAMANPTVFVEIELMQGSKDKAPEVTVFVAEGEAQLARIDFGSPYLAPPPMPILERPVPVQDDQCHCRVGDPMCTCL